MVSPLGQIGRTLQAWVPVVGCSSCEGISREFECGLKPVLLWLRLTPSPNLFSLSPSCFPGGNQAGGQSHPSQTFFFFFLAQRGCSPFQFSETLLSFPFKASDITGKRNWTDVLAILRHLLHRSPGNSEQSAATPALFQLRPVSFVPCSPCPSS